MDSVGWQILAFIFGWFLYKVGEQILRILREYHPKGGCK